MKIIKDFLKEIFFSWDWVQRLFLEYLEEMKELLPQNKVVVNTQTSKVFVIRSEKMISKDALWDENMNHLLNPFSECEPISDLKKDFYKMLDPFIRVQTYKTDFYGDTLRVEATINVVENNYGR